MGKLLHDRENTPSGLPPEPMSSDLPPDITGLLLRSGDGDEVAREQLLAAVHRELHDRAAALMRGQPSCHTLQATALVNEAYLRLLGANGRAYQNRTHFLAVAATAMRQILVDHARSKGRAKRSAPGERVPLDGLVVEYEQRAIDIDLLDRVMEELAEFDPAMVRAVEMRFFADMTAAETAEVLGIAMRTFERRWNATRSWLMQRLEA